MKALDALDRALSNLPEWALPLAAFVLRAVFSIALGHRYYQIDESGFSGMAWNLALHGVLGRGTEALPGPPVPVGFIAFFFGVFGHDPLWPRLGQAAVGAATAWMIGRMTERLTGSPRAGRFALAIAAVYPFFIYYNGILMSETLYVALTVLGVWKLCEGLGGGAPKTLALAGLSLALAGLTRTEGALLGPALWAAAGVMAFRRRISWRAWALGVLCWTLPLAAWALRNRALTGSLTLDSHGGMTLVHGTILYDVDQERGTGEAMRQAEGMTFYQEVQKLPERDRDAALRRAAVDWMRAHPLETAVQWARKLFSFWRLYPRADNAYYENPASRPDVGVGRLALIAASLAFEPWLVLGGLYGLWLLRPRWDRLSPVLLFIVGTMGVHVLVVSAMRYRLPVMPFLMAGAAYWLGGDPKRQSTKR